MSTVKKKRPDQDQSEQEHVVLEVDEFMDSLEGLPLVEQIDRLGQEIMAGALYAMKMSRKYGKKNAQRYIDVQEEMVCQFKILTSTYEKLQKLNRVSSSPDRNKEFEDGLLERIKVMESSMPSIVRKVPKE